MSGAGGEPERPYAGALPGAAVVLAGGGSRRMGRDKALLDAGDGATLLARALALLAPSFDELVVSVGAGGATAALEEALGALSEAPRIVLDRRVDAGPLAGIEAALAAVRSPSVFVVAVDFPEISVPLAALLGGVLGEEACRGCVSRGAGRLQPAYAVYRAELLPEVTAALAAGERRLGALARLPGVRVLDLDEPAGARALAEAGEARAVEAVFRNLNAPEDYEAWRRDL